MIVTQSHSTGAPSVDAAIALFARHIPKNTKLLVEEINTQVFTGYVLRLEYTSQRSGRVMCTVAKGERLPDCEDGLFWFYLRQLVLTPAEQGREFSRLYFLEKRARQEAFLQGSYEESKRISIVAGLDDDKDRLSFKEYA